MTQRTLSNPTRRELLRVGGLSLLGLSLPRLLAAADNERTPARAKSCIFLFLAGGPSQFETFDPKPDAPAEVRSLFGTVPSSVPGTRFGAGLEDVAALAHKFALVRTAWHRYGGHFGGHRYSLSGFPAPGSADQPARPDDKPGLVGLAAKYLQPRHGFPVAVMAPWPATDQGSGVSGGMGGGTLGRQFNPLLVEADPASLGPRAAVRFRVPELSLHASMTGERFDDRRRLLGTIEAQRRDLHADADEMDGFYRRAADLLTSPRIREGFDVTDEPRGLRDRYGANAFGQSCLLARRLIERGARFVQVNFARFVTQTGYGWDTHNAGRTTLGNHLLPKLNAGLASLLTDLDERGLLDETLVVCMGEFGRTARLRADGGRDHWPGCYSLLLAGGGIHGGLVHGRSDRIAQRPMENPVEARQILLTVLTLLGVPTFVRDSQGRAAPLFEGVTPVERLYL